MNKAKRWPRSAEVAEILTAHASYEYRHIEQLNDAHKGISYERLEPHLQIVTILNGLADFIDPECYDYENGGQYGFTCSECGEWTPHECPAYCPHCGCRVVGVDDR